MLNVRLVALSSLLASEQTQTVLYILKEGQNPYEFTESPFFFLIHYAMIQE